ncbi:hypothetical protein ZHAS_00005801 [Anopheles sinensis]|uniref:Uncharacterized protein n=1 Tax=Anopheles sinensis TaxID=74873 RepID=A0A084VK97_ANOSI|nr:hypothetical protein ZHAS_00005801 [Anopheles sinensis]
MVYLIMGGKGPPRMLRKREESTSILFGRLDALTQRGTKPIRRPRGDSTRAPRVSVRPRSRLASPRFASRPTGPVLGAWTRRSGIGSGRVSETDSVSLSSSSSGGNQAPPYLQRAKRTNATGLDRVRRRRRRVSCVVDAMRASAGECQFQSNIGRA